MRLKGGAKVINRGNTKSRLLKVLDILDKKDKSIINDDVLIVIKEVGDNDYYYIDKQGNKTPITQAVAEHSLLDSKGKLIEPLIIKVSVVPLGYLFL